MKNSNRFISMFLTVAIVFVSMVFFVPKSNAETIASLQEEQSKIKDKIAESEKKLSELNDQIDAQEKAVTELNIQLSNLNDEYNNVVAQKNVVDGEIAKTEKKIQDLELEIAKKDAKINATIEIFCKRLRANYMAGGSTTLEMLSNASNVSVFLNRLELLKRVTDNDQSIVDKLNQEIADLEESKKTLEEEKQNLVKQQAELGRVQSNLQETLDQIKVKSAEVKSKLDQLQSNVNVINEDLAGYDTQEAQIQAQINKIYAQQRAAEEARRNSQSQGSGGSINSGTYYFTPKTNPTSGFAFPVEYGSCYMSSGYGYRVHPITGVVGSFHTGIDITGGGIYGQPIVASRSGTVIVAEYYSNSGYGHYVMIDHGDGYQTLYGHCSSVIVSYGQTVKQGQVIAYVGSTGNSTGPHLHFEVRYQGSTLNPLNYISF